MGAAPPVGKAGWAAIPQCLHSVMTANQDFRDRTEGSARDRRCAGQPQADLYTYADKSTA